MNLSKLYYSFIRFLFVMMKYIMKHYLVIFMILIIVFIDLQFKLNIFKNTNSPIINLYHYKTIINQIHNYFTNHHTIQKYIINTTTNIFTESYNTLSQLISNNDPFISIINNSIKQHIIFENTYINYKFSKKSYFIVLLFFIGIPYIVLTCI